MSSILKVDTIQNTGGTTGLTINSSGFVAPKVPVLSVSLSSNTAVDLANNQYHLVDFSTYGAVDFDNTSAWDSANEKWTPQTAGYYSVSCTLNGGDGTVRAMGPALYKNGSIYKSHIFYFNDESYGDDIAASFTTLLYLNGSTDYIQMYGYVYDINANERFFGGNKRTQMTAHFVST